MLLCTAIRNLWDNFYATCVMCYSEGTRHAIGIVLMIITLMLFSMASQGGKKTDFGINWFWFWISAIFLILAVIFMGS